MEQKIDIDGKEYEIDKLSKNAILILNNIEFSNRKIKDLNNMTYVLQRAKVSYMESLKKEMISSKSGLIVEEE
tara:strand:+ start:30 stop:248 length:219 start_codon:yes stop_codon:yes gene_type:complete